MVVVVELVYGYFGSVWSNNLAPTLTSGTAIFGNNGTATTPVGLSGKIWYETFTTGSSNGFINSIQAKLNDSTSGSYSVQVGIYDSGGTLLASSGNVTVSVGTSATNVKIALTSSPQLFASTKYILAITTPASGMDVFASSTTGGTTDSQTGTNLPASQGTLTSSTDTLDLYATYHNELASAQTIDNFFTTTNGILPLLVLVPLVVIVGVVVAVLLGYFGGSRVEAIALPTRCYGG